MSIIKNILKRILSSIQMVNTLLQGHQLFTLNPAFRIANGHIKHFQKNVSFLGPVSPILKTRKFYLLLSILSTDNKSRSHSNSVLVARFQILSPERILWGSVALHTVKSVGSFGHHDFLSQEIPQSQSRCSEKTVYSDKS